MPALSRLKRRLALQPVRRKQVGDCVFCRIVKGEIPSVKVYEDDMVLAFDDISPAAPVHVVIIPKRHIPTLVDVRLEEWPHVNAMVAAAPHVARLKGVDQRGFRTVINCQQEGGQVVFHLHMHLLGGRIMGNKLG